MGEQETLIESFPFRSYHFTTELLPDKFFLFLLWSDGFNKLEDIDKLVVNCEDSTERDESKIYIDFRIGNSSLKKEDSFGVYDKTGINSHSITFKRLFNKRFTNKNFLDLIKLYDDVTFDRVNNSQLEILIKKQVTEAFNLILKSQSDFKSFSQSKNFTSANALLNEIEKEKLISFYKQQDQLPLSPSHLQLLLKKMFFINCSVDFKNKKREIDYHKDEVGLNDPHEKYRLGKIVLDSYVKYTDVVATIQHLMLPAKEIIFNSKVDYIPLEQRQNKDDNSTEVLIPLTNNTKDNYSGYSLNGINVQFPSCIFAYTIQLIRGKIELLYKLHNSKNYFSLSLENNEEVSINESLNYSLDTSGNLIFVDENYSDKIVASHCVKVKFFKDSNGIRLQTEETAVINTEEYYHQYLKSILNRKINYVLDVFLPVIYERNIDLE